MPKENSKQWLKNRVSFLENTLCPFEQHEYTKYDSHVRFDDLYKNYYICKKCGKKIKKIEYYCP